MTPTREQIEAVRRTFPSWDDWTIRRHLQQRAELSALAMRQRRRLFYVPAPMVEQK